MQWISGVLLFICTVVMGFTGQLLRWDSNGVWSTLVGAEQLSRVPLIGPGHSPLHLRGRHPGRRHAHAILQLPRIYLPCPDLRVVGFHLYLVIRNGISEPAQSSPLVDKNIYRQRYQAMLKDRGVPFWPDAAWRDVVFGSLTVGVIAALALFVGAPELVGPPDPANVLVKPHPDWYLLWPEAL